MHKTTAHLRFFQFHRLANLIESMQYFFLPYEMQASLKFVLALLRVTGCDPTQQNALSKILKYTFFVGLLYTILLLWYELLFHFNMEDINKVDSLPAMTLILVKFISFNTKMIDLLEITKMTEQMWPLTKFGQETEGRVLKIHKLTYRFVTIFAAFSLNCALLFYLTPFIASEPKLPLPNLRVCRLDEPLCFWVQYAHLVLVGFQLIPFYTAFDALFLVFVCYSYCSIEMINEGLRRIEDLPLQELIDEHNFALKFISKVDSIYSDVLFVQFLGWTGQMIFCLCLVTVPGVGVADRIKYTFFYITLVGQMLIYCIGGTIIASKTKTVADEALYVKWYNSGNIQLAKSMRFVIEVAQKGKQLTVGKMFTLNLECLVEVLKMSTQIFMLISAVEGMDNS